jgi:hypothetical protein
MKKFLFLACALIVLTGCSTIDKLLLHKSDDVQTLVSEVPRFVVKADGTISTNAGPVSRVEVSPSGDRIEFVTVETKQTNSVYEPNSKAVTAIQTGRAIGGLIPGWGGIIDGLGGIAIAGLTWYARKKNDHASAASILIEGIEKTAGSEAVKATVQDLALKAGKSDLVHGLVQKVTGGKI